MGYESETRVRKPCIMLVQVEPGEESTALGLRELSAAVRIVRVRHPLPACHRMRIVRPLVVIVGESVRSWALPFVEAAARDVDAPLLQLGGLLVRGALREWLMRAVEKGLARRAAEGSR